MAKAEKLPSGTWRVQAYKNGVRKSFSALTKEAAEAAACMWKLEQSDPRHPEHMRLQEAFDRYINARSKILSPATIREYKRIKRSYLQGIMFVPIDKLTTELIQAAINEEATHLAPKSLRCVNGLLSAVMKAYAPGYQSRVVLPQKERNEIVIPSEEEIRTIYQAVKDTYNEIPFLLASQAGMREGEICGLQFKHIDRAKNTIRICQAKVRVEHGTTIKAPKSYSGNRTLTVSPFLIERIFVLSENTKSDAFVVPWSMNAVSHRWAHVLKQAGVPHFKFHALRHYFASQLLLAGVPIKYACEMMGHDTESKMHLIYQHTFPEAKLKFSAAMASKTESLLGK